jgi:hypothetical protein
MRILLTLALALTLSSCAGFTTKQKIAASCESIASGVDSATAAKRSGRISAADLQRVVDYANPTKSFCQPIPAGTLSPADYAALVSAAAKIAIAPGVQP